MTNKKKFRDEIFGRFKEFSYLVIHLKEMANCSCVKTNEYKKNGVLANKYNYERSLIELEILRGNMFFFWSSLKLKSEI